LPPSSPSRSDDLLPRVSLRALLFSSSFPFLGVSSFIRREIITLRPYRPLPKYYTPLLRARVTLFGYCPFCPTRGMSCCRPSAAFLSLPPPPPALPLYPRYFDALKSPSRQDDRAQFNFSCLALVAFVRSLFRSLPSQQQLLALIVFNFLPPSGSPSRSAVFRAAPCRHRRYTQRGNNNYLFTTSNPGMEETGLF